MRVLYPGKMITITLENGKKYKVIPKNDLDELLRKGLTRKKAREYNIGSRLWNNTYNYHYKSEEIEKHRVDKIKTTNAINRHNKWEENLSTLETISPGITELFKNNIRDNPEIITEEIERLSDLFHEMKLFLKLSKKYIRQSCKRKGVKYIKMVSNTSEYLLKRTLKELGYKPEVQPYIGKLWYDFQIGGNILIELDGENYHTVEKDRYKEKIAKENGFKVIRIDSKELNDLETLKIKLRKCLQEVK